MTKKSFGKRKILMSDRKRKRKVIKRLIRNGVSAEKVVVAAVASIGEGGEVADGPTANVEPIVAVESAVEETTIIMSGRNFDRRHEMVDGNEGVAEGGERIGEDRHRAVVVRRPGDAKIEEYDASIIRKRHMIESNVAKTKVIDTIAGIEGFKTGVVAKKDELTEHKSGVAVNVVRRAVRDIVGNDGVRRRDESGFAVADSSGEAEEC